MSNICVFNTAAALAFARLYEAFPHEIKLEVAELDPDTNMNFSGRIAVCTKIKLFADNST